MILIQLKAVNIPGKIGNINRVTFATNLAKDWRTKFYSLYNTSITAIGEIKETIGGSKADKVSDK